MSKQNGVENKVGEIRRKTRARYSAEEKTRIVLEGLRGEESIAALCRREGIASNLYYSWSKEFLEAGKRRLMGDTKRQATSGEVLSKQPAGTEAILIDFATIVLILSWIIGIVDAYRVGRRQVDGVRGD